MEKEFIPYEQAVALKELGFDEPCFKVVEGGPIDIFPYEKLDVPLYQQAFSFFREKHDLPSHIAIYWQHDWNNYSYEWNIVENHKQWNVIEHFKTYEEAELACLNKLIEIVKNK